MALTRVVLDTSAYSWLRRGQVEVGAIVLRAAWVGMPAVVVGELRAGFALGSRRERNEADLRGFLSRPPVAFLPVDEATTARYGRIFADLRRAGTPIPTNDIWVAAAAAVSGAMLVSFDEDFDRVSGLDHHLLTP